MPGALPRLTAADKSVRPTKKAAIWRPSYPKQILVRYARPLRRRRDGIGDGRRGLIQDAVVDREQRQLQTVGDADLVIDVAQVVLDDLLGGAELGGDFFILVSLNDERNDA